MCVSVESKTLITLLSTSCVSYVTFIEPSENTSNLLTVIQLGTDKDTICTLVCLNSEDHALSTKQYHPNCTKLNHMKGETIPRFHSPWPCDHFSLVPIKMAVTTVRLRGLQFLNCSLDISQLEKKSSPSFTLSTLTADNVTSPLCGHSALLPVCKMKGSLGWSTPKGEIRRTELTSYWATSVPMKIFRNLPRQLRKQSNHMSHQLCVVWRIEVSQKNSGQFLNAYLLKFVLNPIRKVKTT